MELYKNGEIKMWKLYLLYQPEKFKIGITKNIDNRIKTLQSYWGKFDLDTSYLVASTKKGLVTNMEKILHNIYSDYNIKDLPQYDGYTEFFKLDCFQKVKDTIKNFITEDFENCPELTLIIPLESDIEINFTYDSGRHKNQTGKSTVPKNNFFIISSDINIKITSKEDNTCLICNLQYDIR